MPRLINIELTLMKLLPKFKFPKINPPKIKLPKISFGFLKREIKFPKFWQKKGFSIFCLILIFAGLFFSTGLLFGSYFYPQIKNYFSKLKIELPQVPLPPLQIIEKQKIVEIEKGPQATSAPIYLPQTSQEEAVIKVVKESSPSVVSIIISKNLPIIEEYYTNPFEEFFGQESPLPFEFKIPQYRQKGNQKQEVGGGSGFIISEEGMILTNKHVVLDQEAEYTVLTTDGKRYPAKVLALDPIQDLAVIKINAIGKSFKPLKLGDSLSLQIGQTVIAIGNALGEFKNTVSVGVISGLGRTITASGGSFIETIEDVIQTDAAINQGNSGGPLLNLRGEVIGINTATVLGAQNIGFAVPINKAKKDIENIKTHGKIIYPFLGIRYVLIDEKVQKKNNLSVNYGALIIKGDKGEPAITPASAAEKAGLQEGDIILKINNEKITLENSLIKIIQKYEPGDRVSLRVLRGTEEKTIPLILGERS